MYTCTHTQEKKDKEQEEEEEGEGVLIERGTGVVPSCRVEGAGPQCPSMKRKLILPNSSGSETSEIIPQSHFLHKSFSTFYKTQSWG